MSQAEGARRRQQIGNAVQRAAPQWNNPERKMLLVDAYIGAPLRLSRQPDLCCAGHTWNTSVDELSKMIYGQKVHVDTETARFLNSNPAYMVRKSFYKLFG
jgi:hypothetical protein